MRDAIVGRKSRERRLVDTDTDRSIGCLAADCSSRFFFSSGLYRPIYGLFRLSVGREFIDVISRFFGYVGPSDIDDFVGEHSH